MDDEVAKILSRKRPYASYFHFGGDKQGTEVGATRDWLAALYADGPDHFASLEYRENPNDPPDVVLVDTKGARHGVEVTEFVDGRMISAHIKNHETDIKEYSEAEFRTLVLDRITTKAGVPFKDTTCVSKRLIIYSDEPFFICGDGVLFLSRFTHVSQTFFDEIWFIIPPAVNISGRTPANSHCRIYGISKR